MQLLSPSNELDRLISLSKYDLEFLTSDKSLKNLSKLAASIAGTEISLVNLIDSATQWSVAAYGIDLKQMPREEAVCQFTIMKSECFEVSDLSIDDRFKDKFYVKSSPFLKYYFGIPLINQEGMPLGALCVMDKNTKKLTVKQEYELKVIAEEVIQRLEAARNFSQILEDFMTLIEAQKKIAHDIRGPLGGIAGLSDLILTQEDEITKNEIIEFTGLIKKSSESLLELSQEILQKDPQINSNQILKSENGFTLKILKEKLEALYSVQAVQKQIAFSIECIDNFNHIHFQKSKIVQIAGNLISNAIKFTPSQGEVKVRLAILENSNENFLDISVIDSGIGMSFKKIQEINNGHASSKLGTQGEKGFGFGLKLVKVLVESMSGTLDIQSIEGTKTIVNVRLPLMLQEN